MQKLFMYQIFVHYCLNAYAVSVYNSIFTHCVGTDFCSRIFLCMVSYFEFSFKIQMKPFISKFKGLRKKNEKFNDCVYIFERLSMCHSNHLIMLFCVWDKNRIWHLFGQYIYFYKTCNNYIKKTQINKNYLQIHMN